MAALTSLDNIKAITRGEDGIQQLQDTDIVVQQALADVDELVKPEIFGNKTEIAQRYLAAHFLSQALTDSGGRGPVSSETIGGISRSWTLPYLNQKSVLGATQYGMQYLEIRRAVVPPVTLVKVQP